MVKLIWVSICWYLLVQHIWVLFIWPCPREHPQTHLNPFELGRAWNYLSKGLFSMESPVYLETAGFILAVRQTLPIPHLKYISFKMLHGTVALNFLTSIWVYLFFSLFLFSSPQPSHPPSPSKKRRLAEDDLPTTTSLGRRTPTSQRQHPDGRAGAPTGRSRFLRSPRTNGALAGLLVLHVVQGLKHMLRQSSKK